MVPLRVPSLLLGAFIVSRVAAHGHVDWLITNGVAYRGYDAPAFSWNPDHDPVVGWTIGATDNGYVEPKSFSEPDIICHKSAKAAKGHVTVQAGDKINLQWNTWPESHKGPVIDYMAKCPGNCEDADKTKLEFFKISASGLIDMSRQSGKWASDVLASNGFSWTVQIPTDLSAGNYVLRHEIIALHGSGQLNGAQNYPQCFNIKVTGGGSLAPAGVQGTALYRSNDPGILFNLYTTPLSYEIPGPTLVSGLPSTAVQVVTSASVTSSATKPDQNGGSSTTTSQTSTFDSNPNSQPTSGSNLNSQSTFDSNPNSQSTFDSNLNSQSTFSSNLNSQPTFSSKPNSQPTFSSKPNSQPTFSSKPNSQPTFGSKPNPPPPFSSGPNSQPNSGSKPNSPPPFGSKPNSETNSGSKPNSPPPFGSKPNSQLTSITSGGSELTTLATSTKSTVVMPATTTEGIVCGLATGGLPKYSQCGGQGYTGPTVCAWGSTCKIQNPYYSQCL